MLELRQERQPLNVVPMQMANKNVHVANRRIELLTEVAKARSEVKHQWILAGRGN